MILFFGDLVFAQVNSFVGVVRPQKTENAMKFDEEKMQETINKNKEKSSQKKRTKRRTKKKTRKKRKILKIKKTRDMTKK